MTELIVAIDGPGGVGKSTVSRLVASRLGASHLDTGAFYRAATLLVLEADTDPSDQDAVMAAVEGVEVGHRDGRTHIGGRNVSLEIRTDAVTAAVSAVSAHPRLRERLVAGQRAWVEAAGGRAVVEGRDIGTVVFPEADLKVFLDAHPEIRAARRSSETGGRQGVVAEALAQRDRLDSNRTVSPLRPAPDAIVIDTSDLEIGEVVETILALT